MPSWDHDIITTTIDWQDGRVYYVKPVSQGSRGQFQLTKQKPRTKGAGTKVDLIPAEISTEHYTYRCRKSEKGRVLITRAVRSGKRRPRKTTPTARKSAPAPTPTKPKTKKRKRRTTASKPDSRQMFIPWTWWIR